MTLATLIRIKLLAAVAVICVAAIRQGTNILNPWLLEAMIIVTLIGGCAWAILIARALVGGLIGWMLSWGAIWLAAIMVGALLSFRGTVLPQGEFYTLTDADAVTVEMEVRGGSEIWAAATNRRHDWLRNALVAYTLYFDNGEPTAGEYRYGIGNGYLGKSESASKRVVSKLRYAAAVPTRTEPDAGSTMRSSWSARNCRYRLRSVTTARTGGTYSTSPITAIMPSRMSCCNVGTATATIGKCSRWGAGRAILAQCLWSNRAQQCN